MHRSGTSMTASWLEKCGLHLSNSLKGDTGNEHGHFEDTEFLALQSGSIKRQLPDSKGWIVNGNCKIAFDSKEYEQAKLILAKRKELNFLWGWKDPRTTLFLADYSKIVTRPKVLLLLERLL
jgi:hypothetical protein